MDMCIYKMKSFEAFVCFIKFLMFSYRFKPPELDSSREIKISSSGLKETCEYNLLTSS